MQQHRSEGDSIVENLDTMSKAFSVVNKEIATTLFTHAECYKRMIMTVTHNYLPK